MIKLDTRGANSLHIGEENGLNIDQEFLNYRDRISEIITNLYARKDLAGQGLGWMNLGYSQETIWYVKEYAALVENRFENILILGIGGSTLGGNAVISALLNPYWNLLTREQRHNYPRIFFIDNVDPDELMGLLDVIDLNKTLVNVVTKSGDTLETMAQFMIIKDILEQKLGDDYRKNIVATTDKRTGILRQIAEQDGYKTFVVPDDVGGRFSVFTAVGLLPFVLTGINIDKMLDGVKDMDAILKNTDIFENIAAQNALINYLMDVKLGKNITVMMPYSSRLKYISDWFVQLWAESLGKYRETDNKYVGSTPLKAFGATDQHSLLQLFNQGPNDKIINFLRVEKLDKLVKIPNIFEYTGIGYLGGKTLEDLLNAEADSTCATLHDFKRPFVTLTIPRIDEYYIGQILYLFEVQTAIAGELYNINTFSQPSIETARNYTYALMGRIGYEESAKSLKDKMVIV